MSRGAWVAASIFVVALLKLTWVAYQFGVFASSGALDRDAEALDGGVLDEWPFEDTDLDASVPDDAGPDAGARPSAGHFDGKAGVGLKNFSMKDHQGREVLRIQLHQFLNAFYQILRRLVVAEMKFAVAGHENHGVRAVEPD